MQLSWCWEPICYFQVKTSKLVKVSLEVQKFCAQTWKYHSKALCLLSSWPKYTMVWIVLISWLKKNRYFYCLFKFKFLTRQNMCTLSNYNSQFRTGDWKLWRWAVRIRRLYYFERSRNETVLCDVGNRRFGRDKESLC